MLNGFDFSHYNRDEQVAKYIKEADFIFHKLTENTGYVDIKVFGRVAMFKDIPTFFYHVVRPDKNVSPAGEVSHFVAQLAKMEKQGVNFGIALDLEDIYVKDKNRSYVIEFIKKIREAYKVPVIVYMGDLYNETFYNEIAAVGGLLWIARWRTKVPEHLCEFWQNTDKYNGEALDHDYCFLTKSELADLCINTNKIPEADTAKELSELLSAAICVINGEYGSGEERKKRLGDKYGKVQKIINFLYKEINV